MNRCLRFLLFGLILTGTISGQGGSSSQGLEKKVMLSGRVYDTNGAVVMGSDVLARDRDGQDYRGRTNSEGIYKIKLPIGIYKIEANANGFCPKRVARAFAGEAVAAGNRTFKLRNPGPNEGTLNFVLEVATTVTPETIGPRCKQRTMIKKDPRKTRPDVFRNIAD
jgi:hypothetical protein